MSADLRTQAKSLTIACSVVNGDIFLVFPDCHVRRIDREDWLRDVEFICSMKPTPSADFRFATAGMTFELIKYEDCHICGGSGIKPGGTYAWTDPCPRCDSSGVLYTWTGKLVTRGDLIGEQVAS